MGVDYRVRVRVYTDEKANAVTIPRAALFRSAQGNWQTFVVRDGTARLVDVEIGLRNDVEVEILAGVEAGESVVVAPDSTLQDEARVEVLSSTAAAPVAAP